MRRNSMKTISLKTLATATEQEVFDYVAYHLLTQNEKSYLEREGRCTYRGKSNLKCAGGCLIADDEYKPSFEGNMWAWLVQTNIAPLNHATLILDLQHVHDDYEVVNWREQLSKVAEEFSLKFNLGELA